MVTRYAHELTIAADQIVRALLTLSLELGMALLAILGLFMPRQCSTIVARAATWLSTLLRRLRVWIGSKRSA